MKNYLIPAVVAVVVAGLVGFVYFRAPVAPSLGASGQTFSFPVFFQDNVTIGGYDYATSSQGASTYPAVAFARARVIEQQAPGALTATLPTNAALSSAGYLQNVGDTGVTFIHASTTLVTLAGNTLIDLQSASTSKAIPPGQTARLECTRLSAAESRRITCLMTTD